MLRDGIVRPKSRDFPVRSVYRSLMAPDWLPSIRKVPLGEVSFLSGHIGKHPTKIAPIYMNRERPKPLKLIVNIAF